MTDTALLMSTIHEKGLKLGVLAEKIGLSRQGFGMKVTGKVEFKASEIVALAQELGLSPNQRDAIFFCSMRECNSRSQQNKEINND